MPRTYCALWDLIVLMALTMDPMTAVTTQDILGLLGNNETPSSNGTSTNARREASSMPATTTKAPAPSTNTEVPAGAPATHAPETSPPPQPDQTTREKLLPQPSIAESNTTSTQSSRDDDDTLPQAVARAKPSANSIYVWIVAGAGIVLTVASAVVVSLKRKLDTARHNAIYLRSNAIEPEVPDFITTRVRWSLPCTISMGGTRKSETESRQSSELFVVDESEDGDKEAHRDMFAVHEFPFDTTDLSSDTASNDTNLSFAATRTTRSASWSTTLSTNKKTKKVSGLHDFSSYYLPSASRFRETTDPVTNTTFSVWM